MVKVVQTSDDAAEMALAVSLQGRARGGKNFVAEWLGQKIWY